MGTLLPALLPLLDGTRTRRGSWRGARCGVRPAVEQALELLAGQRAARRGAGDGIGAGTAPLAAAYGLGAGDRRRAASRRARSAIVGALEAGAPMWRVCSGAPASGRVVRLDWEAGAAGLPSRSSRPAPTEAPRLDGGTRSRSTGGVRWLAVRPFDGAVSIVGPLIVPGESACYECLLLRLAGHRRVRRRLRRRRADAGRGRGRRRRSSRCSSARRRADRRSAGSAGATPASRASSTSSRRARRSRSPRTRAARAALPGVLDRRAARAAAPVARGRPRRDRRAAAPAPASRLAVHGNRRCRRGVPPRHAEPPLLPGCVRASGAARRSSALARPPVRVGGAGRTRAEAATRRGRRGARAVLGDVRPARAPRRRRRPASSGRTPSTPSGSRSSPNGSSRTPGSGSVASRATPRSPGSRAATLPDRRAASPAGRARLPRPGASRGAAPIALRDEQRARVRRERARAPSCAALCELLERDAFMIVWANRLSLPLLDESRATRGLDL